jgi:hypothetical protein
MLVGTADVGRDDFQDNGMIDLAAVRVLEFGISDFLHLNQTWFDINNAAIFAHGTSRDWLDAERLRATMFCSATQQLENAAGRHRDIRQLGFLAKATLPIPLGSVLRVSNGLTDEDQRSCANSFGLCA